MVGVRWIASLGRSAGLEIEKICGIATGRKVIWRIALESVEFIRCDGRLQDRRRHKHHAMES